MENRIIKVNKHSFTIKEIYTAVLSAVEENNKRDVTDRNRFMCYEDALKVKDSKNNQRISDIDLIYIQEVLYHSIQLLILQNPILKRKSEVYGIR